MAIKGFHLAWIVVKDIKKAIKYYTETLGLKISSFDENFGWAELVGHEGGALIGIAQVSGNEEIKPGENAVITLSVADIHQARKELLDKGATLEGDVMEIPGVVKLQSVKDLDGNHLQLVETIQK